MGCADQLPSCTFWEHCVCVQHVNICDEWINWIPSRYYLQFPRFPVTQFLKSKSWNPIFRFLSADWKFQLFKILNRWKIRLSLFSWIESRHQNLFIAIGLSFQPTQSSIYHGHDYIKTSQCIQESIDNLIDSCFWIWQLLLLTYEF